MSCQIRSRASTPLPHSTPEATGSDSRRSTHDAQKLLFSNLNSRANGINKRVLELDIEKCFDRISHKAILNRIIAPEFVIGGLRRCLKSGVNPQFPEQGTPQGGVCSPLLANIALNGIEKLGKSVRYADDMVFILKPGECADKLLAEVEKFLSNRGMNVSQKKTKVTASTDGFDFLGWHFYVQKNNGKFRSIPSEDNLKAFRKKVKNIVNKSNYDTETKISKLASTVRGWRNYHKHCKMDGAKFSLWHLAKRIHDKLLQQKNINRHQAKEKIKIAFPTVSFSENKFVNVKGDKSPFDGDLVYWSKRNSILYGGITAKTLSRQSHSCGRCGLKFLETEKIELHHIDGNHNNWIYKNLMAIHSSCHHYLHMSKSKKPRFSEAG